MRHLPDRLILPLWHFFHFTASKEQADAKEVLSQFLDAAESMGDPYEKEPLEGILVYSLNTPGVRAHIEICANLLEKSGDKERAAVFRKVLAQ